MGIFYVWNVKQLRKNPLFIGIAIVFIAALVILLNRTSLFPGSQDAVPTVFTKGDDSYTKVALTFNISWGDEQVHDILTVLAENDVKATFFLSGEWAERHPQIVEKIVEQNHEIGMLGYRYKSYLDQEIQQVRQDLYLAQDTFNKLGFKDIKLLRAPSGHLNEEVVNLAKRLGFSVIHWNVNPNDWENPGTEVIASSVLDSTSNGDIILLHASDAALQTKEALNTILPGLKNKGFELVTITELLYQTETNIEIIE